jgi:hypothetical protein
MTRLTKSAVDDVLKLRADIKALQAKEQDLVAGIKHEMLLRGLTTLNGIKAVATLVTSQNRMIEAGRLIAHVGLEAALPALRTTLEAVKGIKGVNVDEIAVLVPTTPRLMVDARVGG